VIYCFNFRDPGHIARDRSHPKRKCSNCGSDQHPQGRCPDVPIGAQKLLAANSAL